MPPILRNVTRLDAMPLNRTYFTEEGYLRDRPILTSTGIFEYRNPDGSTRRELRLPEDVFATESLKSYLGKPVIITHDAGLVTKDNVARYQIGTILSEGIRSGRDVRADIIIHDTDEMKESGLKELSLGYNLDLEEEPGTWNGMPYDAIQRNIRINHLALVREARAGEQARLNIDSRDSNTLVGGKLMSKIRKNASRADSILSPEELEKAIAEYKAKHGNQAEDEDDVKEAPEVPEKEETPVEPEAEQDADDEEEQSSIPGEIEAVKGNREERAEAGMPETDEKAKALIKDQDDDIGVLIDIIDTLLAERDFKATKKDEDDTQEAPAAEETEDEEETFAQDADDEEEEEEETIPEEDEEPFPEEKKENEDCYSKDGDDEEVEEEEEELTFQKSPKGQKLNTDSIDKIVRQRIELGMIGKKLNLDGLEKKSPLSAKKAIIKAVRPTVRLDGKSVTYINAMYACVVDDVNNRKDIGYQKRQMFNKDSKTVFEDVADNDSAEAARDRMIRRRQENNQK